MLRSKAEVLKYQEEAFDKAWFYSDWQARENPNYLVGRPENIVAGNKRAMNRVRSQYPDLPDKAFQSFWLEDGSASLSGIREFVKDSYHSGWWHGVLATLNWMLKVDGDNKRMCDT